MEITITVISVITTILILNTIMIMILLMTPVITIIKMMMIIMIVVDNHKLRRSMNVGLVACYPTTGNVHVGLS